MKPGDRTRTDIGRDAVRVKPGMHFHPTLVGFIQHKLQRIVTGVFAYFAGQHIGPRQYFRGPKSRAVRFHLEKNGVDPEAFQVIQLIGQGLLLHGVPRRCAAAIH